MLSFVGVFVAVAALNHHSFDAVHAFHSRERTLQMERWRAVTDGPWQHSDAIRSDLLRSTSDHERHPSPFLFRWRQPILLGILSAEGLLLHETEGTVFWLTPGPMRLGRTYGGGLLAMF